jgi:hypothetical protein
VRGAAQDHVANFEKQATTLNVALGCACAHLRTFTTTTGGAVEGGRILRTSHNAKWRACSAGVHRRIRCATQSSCLFLKIRGAPRCLFPGRVCSDAVAVVIRCCMR